MIAAKRSQFNINLCLYRTVWLDVFKKKKKTHWTTLGYMLINNDQRTADLTDYILYWLHVILQFTYCFTILYIFDCIVFFTTYSFPWFSLHININMCPLMKVLLVEISLWLLFIVIQGLKTTFKYTLIKLTVSYGKL